VYEPPHLARLLLDRSADEPGNGCFQRRHFAEVDEPGLRAERRADKSRARARGAHHEHQPVLTSRDGAGAAAVGAQRDPAGREPDGGRRPRDAPHRAQGVCDVDDVDDPEPRVHRGIVPQTGRCVGT